MKKKSVLRFCLAAVCILLGLQLIFSAVGMYLEGAARRSQDPRVPIFTPEEVGKKLVWTIPLLALFLFLWIAGGMLGLKEDALAASGSVFAGNQELNNAKKGPMQRLLLLIAAVFILIGALNGSAYDVLLKAITLCTECVGLG